VNPRFQGFDAVQIENRHPMENQGENRVGRQDSTKSQWKYQKPFEFLATCIHCWVKPAVARALSDVSDGWVLQHATGISTPDSLA
jgi:hypothetical protein